MSDIHCVALPYALKPLSLALCLALSSLTVVQANAAFELPPVEPPKDRLAALAKFHVKQFTLSGNTVFSTETLRTGLLDAYEGREISAEELQELRYKLTQHYINKGFINSGVIIPDQEVNDNIIHLQVVEGKLSELNIADTQHLRKAYLEKRVSNAGEVLNTKTLQERLQILQQSFLVERFNADLGPGLRPGEAVLNFAIVEKERPYAFGVEFNNHRAPSVGSYRLVADAKHYSLTGWGDTLQARIGFTEGLKDYSLHYEIPVTAQDTKVSFSIDNSDSEVVVQPFTALNVESEATTYSAAITHPLYRRYTEDFHYKYLELGVSLDKRHSKTFLLGEPFSFSAGVQNGESKVSVLRFTQNWLDRSRERVVAFYSSINLGLDVWDATNNDGLDAAGNPAVEPDSDFLSWTGQFRWIRRLAPLFNDNLKNSQLWFRIDAQWANKSLLPLEQFAIGGVNTVRGYRENQISSDQGIAASLEWQIPVTQSGNLLLAPFIDLGVSDNIDLPSGSPRHLSSIGVGVLWDPKPFLHTELYWGHALKAVTKASDSDIQDDGIHFSLRMSF